MVTAAVTPEEKAQAAAASQPALPFTLHFTRWECGHHQQRPADIPCASSNQALLICDAIASAISQSQSANAVLLGTDCGVGVYIADDIVRFGTNISAGVPPEASWDARPLVIHGENATLQAILADRLLDARYSLLSSEVQQWDGQGYLAAGDVVTTTMTAAQFGELLRHAKAAGEELAELPPVYQAADELLAKLEVEQADIDRLHIESDGSEQ